MNEFSLIRHYFTGIGAGDADVELAVGDDAALIRQAGGGFWTVAADMLLEGRHFPPDADAALVAARALRVNLSDMAAMGATPRFFTLSISLPEAHDTWLARFSEALQQESELAGVSLIGGDTTAGPLTLSLQVIGETKKPLLRSAARADDDVWVTGQLGNAAAFVAAGFAQTGQLEFAAERFWKPPLRQHFAVQAAPLISAAIDISDGLWQDLGHICERSGLGTSIQLAQLPVDSRLLEQEPNARLRYALTGGDDYELCFTAPPDRRHELEQLANQMNLQISRIGTMQADPQRLCLDEAGQAMEIVAGGYQHF